VGNSRKCNNKNKIESIINQYYIKSNTAFTEINQKLSIKKLSEFKLVLIDN